MQNPSRFPQTCVHAKRERPRIEQLLSSPVHAHTSIEYAYKAPVCALMSHVPIMPLYLSVLHTVPRVPAAWYSILVRTVRIDELSNASD